MASPTVVRRALSAFANNYNKSDGWVEDTLKLWHRGLISITDKDLVRGTETWCRTKRTLPNLARLRELIDADPTTSQTAELNGCPGCDDTGWREMARHYLDKQRLVVRTCVAACDCPKGQRYASNSPGWEAVVKAWRADPWTEHVYHSTAQHPHLTTEQRHTPEQLEAMRAKAKQPRPEVSGWKRPIKRKT